MDADGQHLPSEIESLVRPVAEGRVDFAIGSRILGRHERDNRARWLGIHVFNALIRLLTPVRVTDCSNGFRALRASELARLLLRQDQFHTAELLIDAAKKGIRHRRRSGDGQAPRERREQEGQGLALRAVVRADGAQDLVARLAEAARTA